MRRFPHVIALAGIAVLAFSTACASTSDDTAAVPSVSTVYVTATSTPVGGDDTPAPAPATTGAAPAPAWPTPEDCVSYNPDALSVHYEAGIYQVNDGTKVVARLHAGPGDVVGEQGLALAQRYRKHCYLGRGNTREDMGTYVFDYWRDPSGARPSIPEEDCSSYNKNNLTVENMGSGHGWRVKDHDHVLHVFDTESDARNGRLVLAKYDQICFIGMPDGDDQDVVSYLI